LNGINHHLIKQGKTFGRDLLLFIDHN